MDTDQHSIPRRQSLGSRPAITPSLSVQRAEDGRRKRRTSGRAPAGTDAASTSAKEEGAEYPPGFRRGRAGIDEAKLPVYKFLQQGVREEGAVELLTKESTLLRIFSSTGSRTSGLEWGRTRLLRRLRRPKLE
ncbi:unnamed protein product [Pylaiella littoralis]